MSDNKPLNWSPQPGVGMNVTRRADGGMNLTFTDTSEATLQAWHDFALEHLLGSDRLKRNLYDLRAVKDISEKAVRTAVEVDSDPSARNIRLAVVVGSEAAAKTMRDCGTGTAGDLRGSEDLLRHGRGRGMAFTAAGPDAVTSGAG
jgi:hypothetical protein